MAGNPFGGIKVLLHKRRGHHECISHVRKPLTGCAVDRKFLSWLKSHSGQILHRVCQLCIVQTPKNNRARISGIGSRIGIQHPADPLGQRLSLVCGQRVRGLFRRHFAIVKHLDGTLPRNHISTDLCDGMKPLQIKFALLLFRGVAFEAAAKQNGLLSGRKFVLQRCKFVSLNRVRGGTVQQGEYGQRNRDAESKAIVHEQLRWEESISSSGGSGVLTQRIPAHVTRVYPEAGDC